MFLFHGARHEIDGSLREFMEETGGFLRIKTFRQFFQIGLPHGIQEMGLLLGFEFLKEGDGIFSGKKPAQSFWEETRQSRLQAKQ